MKTLELTQDAVNILSDLLKAQITRLNLAISLGDWDKERKTSAREQIGKLQTLLNYLEQS